MLGLHRGAPGWRRPVAVTVAGVAYAVAASSTRPFTAGADVVTALPLAAAVVVVVLRGRSGLRAGTGAPDAGSEDAPAGPPRRHQGWALWGGLLAVAVGFELFCYLSTPRVAHPTLSSLIDMLDATPVGKTVGFAAWLGLGWYLVDP